MSNSLWPPRRVIEGLSLDIQPGERSARWAVGAGKSTLVNCAALTAEAARITIDDQDIPKSPRNRWGGALGSSPGHRSAASLGAPIYGAPRRPTINGPARLAEATIYRALIDQTGRTA